MTLRLMGKKRGMLQRFDKTGNVVPCTVIQIEPNVVTQVKRPEVDGYSALQLGSGKMIVNDPRTLEKRFSKPLLGHFKKQNVEPRKHLSEARLEDVAGYEVGQELNVGAFSEVAFVDVCGISKGKGFQGVMKLYNMKGGPASHGSSFHRHMGSVGMRTTPGRCFLNGKRASHMGVDRVTVQNLRVVEVDVERGLILVEGAVPGARNSLVYVSPAVKKVKKK